MEPTETLVAVHAEHTASVASNVIVILVPTLRSWIGSRTDGTVSALHFEPLFVLGERDPVV